jgi:catechol 2,3-dioxygenase-like lactoylglutathione lyase family enzyme
MAFQFSGPCPLIEVFDMPTSIRFYRDVLGFQIRSSSGPVPDCGWVWLDSGTAELMLNTMYDDDKRPAVRDPKRTSAHRDTCLYFGCNDLDGAYEHLSANGVAERPPEVAYYGMRQLYLRDPDGYGLCFQRGATQAEYDLAAQQHGWPGRKMEAAQETAAE